MNNRRPWIGLSFLGAIASGLIPRTAAPAPPPRPALGTFALRGRAILTVPQGKVTVTRTAASGKSPAAPAAVEYTTFLEPGDVVRIAEGGAALLIGADGQVTQLGPG